MSKRSQEFKKTNPAPERCTGCGGKGVVARVFYDLDCSSCDGIGWLPVAGHDLAQQLGRALFKLNAHNRILRAQIPEKDISEVMYPKTGRGGIRGEFTGD